MKRLGKYKAVIALLCFTATIFSGCGKKTDAVITEKKSQIETLDEYKKSLIYEYVTGKKEVPAI